MSKGSLLYDFLADSFLFSEHRLADAFASMPSDEVKRELSRYREFCLEKADALIADIETAEDSSLMIYGTDSLELSQLTHAALYVKQYVVQDPLFRLTATRSKAGIALTAAGVAPAPNDGALDLGRLAQVLRLMKAVTPMVAAGFLKFVPSSLHEEDREGIPLYASKNYFEDALPREVLKLFKDAARVQTVIPVGGVGFRFVPLTPCRGICIMFRGDDGPMSMYALHQIERATRSAEDSSVMSMVFTLPDTPPSPEYFRVWVQQSINQAARNRFWKIYDDGSFAANNGLALSTRSPLLFEALRRAIPTQSSPQIHTANVFLNLDLPLLDDINTAQLMRVRQEEGEAFANFRFALDQKLAALRVQEDPHKAKAMASEAIRDLTETQLHDVRLKMRSIRESFKLGAAGTIVSLAAAVQTHGWSLLGGAASSIPLANSVLQYRKESKRHPAFFLWKALSKTGKQPRYRS